MKTSNKILSGAFILIVIIMIFANWRFKTKVDEIKAKHQIIMQETEVQQTDSVLKDSSNVHIKVQIN